jgi:putative glutamine amidotransferase
MARPRILITRAEDVLGERWEDYADRVREAGGEPVAADLAAFDRVESLGDFAGLLITAGVDIDPSRYGQQRSERVGEVNPERDAFEEALFAEATGRSVPVLGICRGVQVINVARGGGLLQHLEQREPHRARRGPDGSSIESGWHEVLIEPGTLLEHVTGEESVDVNSRHHQAILPETLAPGLVASARSADGVVEAVEDPSHPWLLGVQWHPERLEMVENAAVRSASVRIFRAFVAACSGAGR